MVLDELRLRTSIPCDKCSLASEIRAQSVASGVLSNILLMRPNSRNCRDICFPANVPGIDPWKIDHLGSFISVTPLISAAIPAAAESPAAPYTVMYGGHTLH